MEKYFLFSSCVVFFESNLCAQAGKQKTVKVSKSKIKKSKVKIVYL